MKKKKDTPEFIDGGLKAFLVIVLILYGTIALMAQLHF